MFGTEFRHDLIRKHVILFGSLFNDITITRKNESGAKFQNFKVPVSYGPREKYLAITTQKPDAKRQSIILPLMTFELTGATYDADRQLNRFNNHYTADRSKSTLELAPWDINFELNIIAKNNIDATGIVEQILPYFDPKYNISAELLEGFDPFDIAIDLNSVQQEDTYIGSFEERRTTTWTLAFTVHGYFAKPVKTSKLIKFVESNIYPSVNSNVFGTRFAIQPGLTSNGEPTSNISQSVPVADINANDDFGYVVTVTDLP